MWRCVFCDFLEQIEALVRGHAVLPDLLRELLGRVGKIEKALGPILGSGNVGLTGEIGGEKTVDGGGVGGDGGESGESGGKGGGGGGGVGGEGGGGGRSRRGSMVDATVSAMNEWEEFLKEDEENTKSGGRKEGGGGGGWGVMIVKGKDGKDGVDGKAGMDGVTGKDGEDGEKGEKGDSGGKGRDGVDGRSGVDGVDGRSGSDGRDGEDGKSGVDGRDGRDGRDGGDGVDGRDGRDGGDGMDGRDGSDGRDGTLGRDGEDGKDGRDGEDGNVGRAGGDGRDGKDGKDGKDASPIPASSALFEDDKKDVEEGGDDVTEDVMNLLEEIIEPHTHTSPPSTSQTPTPTPSPHPLSPEQMGGEGGKRETRKVGIVEEGERVELVQEEGEEDDDTPSSSSPSSSSPPSTVGGGSLLKHAKTGVPGGLSKAAKLAMGGMKGGGGGEGGGGGGLGGKLRGLRKLRSFVQSSMLFKKAVEDAGAKAERRPMHGGALVERLSRLEVAVTSLREGTRLQKEVVRGVRDRLKDRLEQAEQVLAETREGLEKEQRRSQAMGRALKVAMERAEAAEQRANATEARMRQVERKHGVDLSGFTGQAVQSSLAPLAHPVAAVANSHPGATIESIPSWAGLVGGNAIATDKPIAWQSMQDLWKGDTPTRWVRSGPRLVALALHLLQPPAPQKKKVGEEGGEGEEGGRGEEEGKAGEEGGGDGSAKKEGEEGEEVEEVEKDKREEEKGKWEKKKSVVEKLVEEATEMEHAAEEDAINTTKTFLGAVEHLLNRWPGGRRKRKKKTGDGEEGGEVGAEEEEVEEVEVEVDGDEFRGLDDAIEVPSGVQELCQLEERRQRWLEQRLRSVVAVLRHALGVWSAPSERGFAVDGGVAAAAAALHGVLHGEWPVSLAAPKVRGRRAVALALGEMEAASKLGAQLESLRLLRSRATVALAACEGYLGTKAAADAARSRLQEVVEEGRSVGRLWKGVEQCEAGLGAEKKRRTALEMELRESTRVLRQQVEDMQRELSAIDLRERVGELVGAVGEAKEGVEMLREELAGKVTPEELRTALEAVEGALDENKPLHGAVDRLSKALRDKADERSLRSLAEALRNELEELRKAKEEDDFSSTMLAGRRICLSCNRPIPSEDREITDPWAYRTSASAIPEPPPISSLRRSLPTTQSRAATPTTLPQPSSSSSSSSSSSPPPSTPPPPRSHGPLFTHHQRATGEFFAGQHMGARAALSPYGRKSGRVVEVIDPAVHARAHDHISAARRAAASTSPLPSASSHTAFESKSNSYSSSASSSSSASASASASPSSSHLPTHSTSTTSISPDQVASQFILPPGASLSPVPKTHAHHPSHSTSLPELPKHFSTTAPSSSTSSSALHDPLSVVGRSTAAFPQPIREINAWATSPPPSAGIEKERRRKDAE